MPSSISAICREANLHWAMSRNVNTSNLVWELTLIAGTEVLYGASVEAAILVQGFSIAEVCFDFVRYSVSWQPLFFSSPPAIALLKKLVREYHEH